MEEGGERGRRGGGGEGGEGQERERRREKVIGGSERGRDKGRDMERVH